MKILDIVIVFMGRIFEVYLLFDYFKNFFDIQENLTKRYILLMICGTSILLFCINLFENVFLNLIAVPLILWFFITILFESSFGVRLGYFITAYVVMIGVEFLYLIMSETTLNLAKQTGLVPLSQYAWQLIFVEFLNYVVFAILKHTSSKSKIRLSNKMFYIYMCLPLSTMGCMVTIFYSGVDFSDKFLQKVLMTIFFMFMLVGNVLVFYIFQKYTESLYQGAKQQVELIRQRAELHQLSQITEINENYKEMVHNTSHFLKVIEMMAVEEQNDEIYKLVKELYGSIEKNRTIVYSNHKILNTLLVENAAEAKKNGILFDAYVEPGTDLEHISDIDLISMLGNLLNNAVVAATKKGKNSLVKVRIFMQKDGDLCVLKIENDFYGPLIKSNGKLQSTQKDGGLHGIGISSVNRTAEKYDGYLEYYVKNERFISVLVLPTANTKMEH